MLVLALVLDEAPHHVGQILKELGLGVDDENGAGGVQAIGEDETVLDTRLPHDVPHLPRDVDGLSAPLALDGKAPPPHLHPRGFGQGRTHRSPRYAASALARTVLSFSTSTGFRR